MQYFNNQQNNTILVFAIFFKKIFQYIYITNFWPNYDNLAFFLTFLKHTPQDRLPPPDTLLWTDSLPPSGYSP